MKNSYNFTCPISGSDWVARESLISKLKGAVLGKKHYFLSAPGGYGKTVAAAQFMSAVGGNTAWLKIEEDDKEEDYFYQQLLQAIGVIIPQKAYRNALTDYTGDYNLSVVLDILSRLTRSARRCYLVIDNIHLASPELKQSLPIIIDKLSTDYVMPTEQQKML